MSASIGIAGTPCHDLDDGCFGCRVEHGCGLRTLAQAHGSFRGCLAG